MQDANHLPSAAAAPHPDLQPRFEQVCLINPPNPPGFISNKDSMGGFGQLYPLGATFLPPLDLAYLTSYLTSRGVRVEVVDCLGLELGQNQLLDRVAAVASTNSSALAIAVVRTSLPTLDWDLSVCAALQARVPNLRIAIYGAVVRHVMPRIEKETAIDYIVGGEPDETVYELVLGHPREQIKGLSFRQSGGWVTNADRDLVRDLDRLPFPKWELFPYQKYQLPKSSARPATPFLPMLTSRGCPIGCHYCPYPVAQGRPWRWRSPLNVVDEVEHLVRDLGIRYIIFRDPMFSLDQKRVIGICDEIKRRGLTFEWRCETRADFLKEETLRAMAAAGCTGVNFGIESADVTIQANVGRRPIPQQDFVRMIALCRELGIKTFAFFIVGLPGDTVDSILKTIKFAIDVRPTWIQFTAASPFLGTKVRDWALARGLLSQDESAYVNSHSVIMGNENLSRQEVKVLYDFAELFERFLVNRRGILKDSNHPHAFYRAAARAADLGSQVAGQVGYGIGARYLRWRLKRAA